jgi:hypothetical protein
MTHPLQWGPGWCVACAPGPPLTHAARTNPHIQNAVTRTLKPVALHLASDNEVSLRGDITMSRTPPVNPDVHNIADRAKHGYATATQLLAATQYRLGELAGTGRLDPDESMSLQTTLFHIWQALYAGTLCAVRDWDTDDCTWDQAENTYSDGREVMIQIRIEPVEDSRFSWEHNRFMLDEGAVNEHPLGTICYISPVKPDDELEPLSDEHDDQGG